MVLPYLRALGVSFILVAGASTAFADKPAVDCSKKSLAQAVADAGTGESIVFTGICARADRGTDRWPESDRSR